MKRILSVIGTCMCAIIACADSTVNIPLTHDGIKISNTSTQTDSTDDSGSSTVDPVDPNQAKAELTNNTLKVYEWLEGEAWISVLNTTNPEVVLQTCFDRKVTLILTDTAQYHICLYHPAIGFVYGTFYYPINNAKKVIQGGKVFISSGNQYYTPNGMKIQ